MPTSSQATKQMQQTGVSGWRSPPVFKSHWEEESYLRSPGFLSSNDSTGLEATMKQGSTHYVSSTQVSFVTQKFIRLLIPSETFVMLEFNKNVQVKANKRASFLCICYSDQNCGGTGRVWIGFKPALH